MSFSSYWLELAEPAEEKTMIGIVLGSAAGITALAAAAALAYRRLRQHRIDGTQHAPALLFAEPASARAVFTDRFPDNRALRFCQPLACLAKRGYGLVVEREGHLHHTCAILPYQVWLHSAW